MAPSTEQSSRTHDDRERIPSCVRRSEASKEICEMMSLYSPIQLGELSLRNRVFMAPMTRNRANPDGTPGSWAETYYRQRSSAGLIITEATQISAMGKGYINTPGIYLPEHIASWRRIVAGVHDDALSCFVEHDPHHLISAARYSAAPIGLARLIFGARQPKHGPDCFRFAKPSGHVDRGAIGQRHHGPDTRGRHQAPAHLIVPHDGQQVAMQDDDLLPKNLADNEQRFDQRRQVGKVPDQRFDALLEPHLPDHADLEAEVAQSTAQIVLDCDRFRLQKLAVGQQHSQLLTA